MSNTMMATRCQHQKIDLLRREKHEKGEPEGSPFDEDQTLLAVVAGHRIQRSSRNF